MLDKVQARYADFRHNWENEGLETALRSSATFVKNNRTILGDPTYQSDRIDNDRRWSLISSRIQPTAANALDIGCNRGAITRRAANAGLFSLGIDRTATTVDAARRRTDSRHCHFLREEIGPHNIGSLPRFDVVFLLVVYYHWKNSYGEAKSEEMLKVLSENTDQLFVETPKNLSYIESEKMDLTSDPRPEIQSYFESVVPDSDVDFVGETPYMGGERTDLIFEIS